MKRQFSRIARAIALAILPVPLRVSAQNADVRPRPDSGNALRDRIDELDQQIRILARRRELHDDSLATAARAQSSSTAGRDGFTIRSADGAFVLKLRGYVQVDQRAFARFDTTPASSTIVLRRVRPIIEGTLYQRIDLRLMPDFGEGKTVLQDAYAEIRVARALALRGGKFKPPIGLERLQSATDIRFVERGLPTNLVPSRDVGFQISGELWNALFAYQIATFNGVPDLGNGDSDASNAKDYVGRVFVQPFVKSPLGRIADVGIGAAWSRGAEAGSTTTPSLATYRTPGQSTLFRYRADGTRQNTAIADGGRARFSPQAYANVGPVGVLGEYVWSRNDVRRADSVATLTHRAWQVAASWFVTGERSSFRGATPRHVFDPGAGSWGAVELKARVGAFLADDRAFPWYANPASSARRADSWAVGASWHLARGVKLVADYERTRFNAPANARARAPESLIITRLQTAY